MDGGEDLNQTDTYVVSADAVSTKVSDGSFVLLQFVDQKYYTLNGTGSRIWEHLSDGKSRSEIEQALRDEYDLDPAHAIKTVTKFLDSLESAGMITSTV